MLRGRRLLYSSVCEEQSYENESEEIYIFCGFCDLLSAKFGDRL